MSSIQKQSSESLMCDQWHPPVASLPQQSWCKDLRSLPTSSWWESWTVGFWRQLVKSRIISSIHQWKVPPNVTTPTHCTAVLPLTLSFLCFSPNSSISLHPSSSHPPQVVCSVLSSTAWINDWCSRPQVKVREVHYWIISALLSLLPSACLLLVDVFEALEGTLC